MCACALVWCARALMWVRVRSARVRSYLGIKLALIILIITLVSYNKMYMRVRPYGCACALIIWMRVCAHHVGTCACAPVWFI